MPPPQRREFICFNNSRADDEVRTDGSQASAAEVPCSERAPAVLALMLTWNVCVSTLRRASNMQVSTVCLVFGDNVNDGVDNVPKPLHVKTPVFGKGFDNPVELVSLPASRFGS